MKRRIWKTLRVVSKIKVGIWTINVLSMRMQG